LNIANERLRELSLRDSLTGLYNRRYLNSVVSERVSSYLKKYAQSHSDPGCRDSAPPNPVGVFLVDIDYFKDVNDTYGHAVGDNVLITFSNVLKQMLGKDDVLVRWGGRGVFNHFV
jgi:diguanylate cyclase (GGDEF)-like protein